MPEPFEQLVRPTPHLRLGEVVEAADHLEEPPRGQQVIDCRGLARHADALSYPGTPVATS